MFMGDVQVEGETMSFNAKEFSLGAIVLTVCLTTLGVIVILPALKITPDPASQTYIFTLFGGLASAGIAFVAGQVQKEQENKNLREQLAQAKSELDTMKARNQNES